ncbi:Zinc finger and BTB domain-containing protein 16 [Fusarium oxysporum f. sp. albedinis]|nr:Zinc finger and BTB domain-containing protein 16 [Fusarium oxysporum f. sp. albedinis]
MEAFYDSHYEEEGSSNQALSLFLAKCGFIEGIRSSCCLLNFINMTGLATYTDAIVTLRPSQLQKLESLGLYYNSPEPAIICVECGFAINPTRAPRHPGDKHHITKSARRGLKPLIYSLNLQNPRGRNGNGPRFHVAIPLLKY